MISLRAHPDLVLRIDAGTHCRIEQRTGIPEHRAVRRELDRDGADRATVSVVKVDLSAIGRPLAVGAPIPGDREYLPSSLDVAEVDLPAAGRDTAIDDPTLVG